MTVEEMRSNCCLSLKRVIICSGPVVKAASKHMYWKAGKVVVVSLNELQHACPLV